MASVKRMGSIALCAVGVLGCSDDSGGGAGSEGTSTGSAEVSTTMTEQADSSGGVCDPSMSDFVPTALPSDVVINIGSSLLTPHPVILSALADVATVFEQSDVRVALLAAGDYPQPFAAEACNQCALGPECDDPIAVNADLGVIEPVARFAGSTSSYSCLFRPSGESVRHFVTFTDTEPAPGELSGFEGFLAAQSQEADVVFDVAYMLGCSQMEGGIAMESIAIASGGTTGNICDGVQGVRAFLEGLAVARVPCGWPAADPGANNSIDNLEVVLLDGPSGGEISMTRVESGVCTEVDDPANPPYEWFVSNIDGVDTVRLCPGTCGAVQANYEPGEISYRQSYTCP